MCRFDIDWVQSYVELRVCMPTMVHERTAGTVNSTVISELTLRGIEKGVKYKDLGIMQTGSVRALFSSLTFLSLVLIFTCRHPWSS